MNKNIYCTTHHSDLYWRVVKLHHKSEKYVKVKLEVFYKSNNNRCEWFPYLRLKILRPQYDWWIPYKPEV